MADNTNGEFNISNISKSKLQELNDLNMLVKKERLKNIKSDIFLDTIIEASCCSFGLNEILCVKVKDIILRGELLNCLQSKKECFQNSDILLENFNNIELSFEEQKDLKIALERRIREKGDTFLKELNELSDNDSSSLEIVDHFRFDVKNEQNNLLVLQKQLIEQQKLYITTLLKLGKHLQELVELKTNIGTEVAMQKVSENVTESERNNLRFKLLSQQVRLQIFEELPLSIDAYRKALNDLQKQQKELNMKLQTLQTDINNYNSIFKNEEYQEVFKEYKQYKRGLENKMWIRNELCRKF